MIAVITASTRTGSRSAIVADAISDMFTTRGEDIWHIRMEELAQDLAQFMMHGKQVGVFLQCQERLFQVNRMIFVVPEYNGSFPGILKFWIDSCRFPQSFAGKKAALVGLGDGMFGNVRGLDHLTAVLNYCQMTVMPFRVHLPRIGNRIQAGYLKDDPDFIRQGEKFTTQFLQF